MVFRVGRTVEQVSGWEVGGATGVRGVTGHAWNASDVRSAGHQLVGHEFAGHQRQRDVRVYFDNDMNMRAPADAKGLVERVSALLSHV